MCRQLEEGSAQCHSQKRDLKRKEVVHDVKFFSTSSGGGTFGIGETLHSRADHSNAGQVPRIITVVPLVPIISLKRFLAGLVPNLGLTDAELEEVSAIWTTRALISCGHRDIKTNLQIQPATDAFRLCGTRRRARQRLLVLVMSSTHEVQLERRGCSAMSQAQVGGCRGRPVVQVSLRIYSVHCMS